MKRSIYCMLSFIMSQSCIQSIYADQEIAKSNVEEYTESTYESRIKDQNKLLQADTKKGKNHQELEILTNNGITITQESFEDLESNSGFSVIKINLFEGENLRHALMSTLDLIEKGAKNNFIMGDDNKILDEVRRTDAVKKTINALQDFLTKMNVNNIDDQAKICELLQNVLDALNTSNIGTNNPFGRFISGILKIYKTEAIRRAADDIMLKLGSNVEQSLETDALTTSASLGAQGQVNGVSVGGSVGASKTGESRFNSFFAISKTKKIEFTVGAGFFEKLFSLKAAVGASVTHMALFNSLEQLMDSGEKIPVLQPQTVKELVESRKKMQRHERQLLALFRDNVEGFFKMMQIIPISTYVEWPSITRASKANELKLTGVNAAGTASLASLGFTVKVAKNKLDIQSSKGYITLLNPDCSSAVYDPAYALNFVGTGYDYSHRYITTDFSENDQNRYDRSGLFTNQTDGTSRNAPREFLEVAVNTILGDLRKYNDTLSSLAEITDEIEELEEKSKKDKEVREQIKNLKRELNNLEASKHEIEKLWKKSQSIREGREGVLKSMIVTLNRLREKAETLREIELFKQAYVELKRLTQLHEFSKNRNKQASFKTTVGKYISSITYVLSLPGGASVTFVNNHGLIPDWDITVSLPATIGGIIAKELILKKMNDVSKQLGQNPSKDVDKNLINAIQITGSLVADQLNNIPSVPLSSSASANIKYSGVTTINIGIKTLTPPTSSLQPLPKSNLVNISETRHSVMHTQIQTTSSLNLGGNLNVGLAAVNASLGKATGKKVWLGGDWFYWSSKYNSFAEGLKDKTPATKVNTPWIMLINNQALQLQKFLMEVDRSDIIKFELQESYNNVLNKAKDDQKKIKEAESTYENLLTQSKIFADDASANNYKKALDAFDKVLEINYRSLAW